MVMDQNFENEINFLNNNSFHIDIMNMPHLTLMINEIEFPGLTFGDRDHPTPLIDYAHQGDTLVFDPLNITFNVDEYMTSYIELWKWMMYLGFPRNTEEFRKLWNHETPYAHQSDLALTILSSKSNPIQVIKFIDAFPVNLSSIPLTEKTAEPVPTTATITFRYSWYYFDKNDI